MSRLALLLPLTLGSTLALAAPALAETTTAFRPSESPAFRNATAALGRLVRSQGKARENHFCLVGRGSGASAVVWVHWAEENALVLWEPGEPVANLAASRRFLHLDRDVVPTEAEVGGSTYLVTRAWVDDLLTTCRGRGDRHVLRRPQHL